MKYKCCCCIRRCSLVLSPSALLLLLLWRRLRLFCCFCCCCCCRCCRCCRCSYSSNCTTTITAGPARCFFSLPILPKMLYRTHRQVLGSEYQHEKKMYVVTPRCMSCCCCSCGAVLRRKNIHVPLLNDASQIDYCRY